MENEIRRELEAPSVLEIKKNKHLKLKKKKKKNPVYFTFYEHETFACLFIYIITILIK